MSTQSHDLIISTESFHPKFEHVSFSNTIYSCEAHFDKVSISAFLCSSVSSIQKLASYSPPSGNYLSTQQIDYKIHRTGDAQRLQIAWDFEASCTAVLGLLLSLCVYGAPSLHGCPLFAALPLCLWYSQFARLSSVCCYGSLSPHPSPLWYSSCSLFSSSLLFL